MDPFWDTLYIILGGLFERTYVSCKLFQAKYKRKIPGMFGYESPNMEHYNETHWHTRWSVLINEGPWHDFVNRYTFKDNRLSG